MMSRAASLSSGDHGVDGLVVLLSLELPLAGHPPDPGSLARALAAESIPASAATTMSRTPWRCANAVRSGIKVVVSAFEPGCDNNIVVWLSS